MPIRVPSRLPVALVATAIALGAAPMEGQAEDCPFFGLPEGQNFARFEHPWGPDTQQDEQLAPNPAEIPGSCVRLWTAGKAELTLALVGRSSLALDVLEQEPYILQMSAEGAPVGRLRVVDVDDLQMRLEFEVLLRRDRLEEYALDRDLAPQEIEGMLSGNVHFVWTLRRRTEHPCSMAMVVDGDASGEFTGDVAYYNYRKPGEGVYEGSAAGTWADEGAQEMVEGLVEWAAGIGDMMDEMGLELPDGSELPSTEELEKAKKKVGDKEVGWAEQLWGWDGENRGSDTFGLALADVELGMTALPDGTPKPPVEGFLQGAAKLASAASLGVSGRAVAVKAVPKTEEGQAEMEALLIEPSRVTAIAGVVDDNLEGIKYLWEPGRPGSATVVVVREIGSGVIRGIVAAELFPERTWAGGPQGIRVVATFRAMPTSLLCQ